MAEYVSHLATLKRNEHVLGVTFSCWDLMHAGHQLFLADAKKQCDMLCVGIQTDPTLDRPEKNKPIQSLEERIIQLSSSRYVNYYFVYTTEASLYEALLHLRADVRFLGDDYIGKRFTGDHLPIKIVYHPRSNHIYSTTALRDKVYKLEEEKRKKKGGELLIG